MQYLVTISLRATLYISCTQRNVIDKVSMAAEKPGIIFMEIQRSYQKEEKHGLRLFIVR